MRTVLLALAIALATAAPAAAAPALLRLPGDFSQPVYVTSPPKDTRVFVVEKPGRIQIVGRGTFLDISSLVNSSGEEQGLLSMAFSPNYASNGLFYVYYTADDGDVKVAEFKRSSNPDRASTSPARTLFSALHDHEFHNGGQLQFGPDGMLYVSIGDNQDGNNAQDLTSPFGKILRLNPATGGAATGNPHGRIWSYGLRNPWRFTFDRTTGDMVIGDVGDATWEEVDWARAASGRGRNVNYGWPCAEGPSGSDSCGTRPVLSYNHNGNERAITGGYVVRDPGLPTLNGRYLYGDTYTSELRSVALSNPSSDRAETSLPFSALSSFGQDACGRIYAASLNGQVYRLHDGAATPCSFSGGGPGGSGDTTKPTVNVSIRGLKRAVKKRRLFVRVRCSEACIASVGTRLVKVKRLKTRVRGITAGHRVTFKVRFTKKTATKLRRRVNRKGFVRVSVTVRATDAAHNTRVVHRHGRIKKP